MKRVILGAVLLLVGCGNPASVAGRAYSMVSNPTGDSPCTPTASEGFTFTFSNELVTIDSENGNSLRGTYVQAPHPSNEISIEAVPPPGALLSQARLEPSNDGSMLSGQWTLGTNSGCTAHFALYGTEIPQ